MKVGIGREQSVPYILYKMVQSENEKMAYLPNSLSQDNQYHKLKIFSQRHQPYSPHVW